MYQPIDRKTNRHHETLRVNRANRLARIKRQVRGPGYITARMVREVVDRVLDELDARGCCAADGEPRPCLRCGQTVDTEHDFCVDCRAELAERGAL